MIRLVKIGDRLINPDNVTLIIGREIHFNNGSRWTALEPEVNDLIAAMLEDCIPEVVTVVEAPIVIKKPTVKKKQ